MVNDNIFFTTFIIILYQTFAMCAFMKMKNEMDRKLGLKSEEVTWHRTAQVGIEPVDKTEAYRHLGRIHWRVEGGNLTEKW